LLPTLVALALDDRVGLVALDAVGRVDFLDFLVVALPEHFLLANVYFQLVVFLCSGIRSSHFN
jgi:hypothetical protein